MVSDAEEDEGRTGCGGAFVLTLLVTGIVTVLYRVSPEAFVLVLWGGGWVAIVWAAKKRPSTPNPAPPPAPERGLEEEPQVSFIRDTNHPNRWVAIRPSRWLDWTDEKTGTS